MRLRIQARRREAGRDAFTQVLAEGNAAGVFHVDDLPAMTTILIAVLQNYEDEFAYLLLDEDRGSAKRLAMAKRHTAGAMVFSKGEPVMPIIYTPVQIIFIPITIGAATNCTSLLKRR